MKLLSPLASLAADYCLLAAAFHWDVKGPIYTTSKSLPVT